MLFSRSASGTERRHGLWCLDVASGQETQLVDPVDLLAGDERLSPQERARRERTRTQAGGVVGYATDERCRIAAFALSGMLFVTDVASGETRQLPAVEPVIDPRPDPTGRRIAYLSGSTLRIIDLDSAADAVLAAPDAGESEDIAWGAAEFIAAEEMNRTRGYWWSPDGSRILAARTDRSAVRRWHITDPAHPERPPATVSYPAAGTDNVDVSLALLGMDGSRIPVTWDGGGFPYLAAVHWSASGAPLIAVQSRDQRRMVVLSIDPETGEATPRHELTDPHWVEIVPGVPAWTTDGRLVMVAPADGAYRLMVDGVPITPVGSQVRAVLDVGEDILFTASEADPTQVHVCTAGAGGAHRLSDGVGVHSAVRGGQTTVLVSWDMEHDGPTVSVRSHGEPVARIASVAMSPPLRPNPTFLTVGERALRCALLLPTGHQPGSVKLPVLLDPYGGPHAQRVLSVRGAYLTSQWFADQGFAVLVVDGRGTPGRGPEWDRAVAGELAEVPLADQIAALLAVTGQYPDLDAGRVAIRGWSFGGYLSALAVLRRPDVVHAAVAGAPVTDWRLYDTHYTERYLGHPDSQPEVYERNSLLPDAENLSRPLMLIHGLADDNVFAAHTLRLSSALLAAGREHTVLPLSGVTHMNSNDEREAESFMLLQLNWIKHALGM